MSSDRPDGFDCLAGRMEFFLMISLILVAGCHTDSLPTVVLNVAGYELTAEIADTQGTRNEGLMNRRSLPENHGMLFVFEYENQVSFWMKNTEIPLSIAFIAADGTIRQIEYMEPRSRASVVSRRNVLYALEVNRGWFKERGIEAGDRVILPF